MMIGMAINFISLVIASISIMLTTRLIQIFSSIIKDIQAGHI